MVLLLLGEKFGEVSQIQGGFSNHLVTFDDNAILTLQVFRRYCECATELVDLRVLELDIRLLSNSIYLSCESLPCGQKFLEPFSWIADVAKMAETTQFQVRQFPPYFFASEQHLIIGVACRESGSRISHVIFLKWCQI